MSCRKLDTSSLNIQNIYAGDYLTFHCSSGELTLKLVDSSNEGSYYFGPNSSGANSIYLGRQAAPWRTIYARDLELTGKLTVNGKVIAE